ncbi:MAG: hypothetical protein KDF65_14670, partial [Anaerolineae bacterium]|nr:hypothetical protein [Anaerolineae bacterium]
MLTASQLAQQLHQLSFSELRALRLNQEIEQLAPLTAAQILALAPQIEAALAESNRLSEQSRRIIHQCLQ